MFPRNYGLLLGIAASLSFLLGGCGSDTNNIDPVTGAATPTMAERAAQQGPVDNTDETIFTFLGLAKRQSTLNIGPQTGATVSPVMWQAAQDTLGFAKFSAEDPMTGLLVTNWYSPRGKPNERLRVTAYILSRALRSDSLSVTVERQERGPAGDWRDTPVARDVGTGLESAILQRARQIHAERYRGDL